MDPIEDGPQWRKSSRSGDENCVEVLMAEDGIAVRHSKGSDDRQLVFAPVEWQAFIDGVRLGEFDLPKKLSA